MIPAQLLVHTASVEPYQGSGPYGPVYGAAFNLPCYFEATRSLVRDAEGNEAVSEAKVYANPGTDVPAGSKVTVAGYASTVITVSTFDDAGLTGLAHREIALA